jgi:hypothetical protein
MYASPPPPLCLAASLECWHIHPIITDLTSGCAGGVCCWGYSHSSGGSSPNRGGHNPYGRFSPMMTCLCGAGGTTSGHSCEPPCHSSYMQLWLGVLCHGVAGQCAVLHCGHSGIVVRSAGGCCLLRRADCVVLHMPVAAFGCRWLWHLLPTNRHRNLSSAIAASLATHSRSTRSTPRVWLCIRGLT